MLGPILPRPEALVAGFPSPSDAVAAAVNLFDATIRGGLADTRRMPSALIDEGPLRRVHRYLPLGRGGRRSAALPVLPVLLVPPLAAPAICFDLRRGCSVAEQLLRGGRETYLVDYGPVRFGDRSLGLEHWIEDVIPNAVRAASEDAGGRPVQLVGWCLGGILGLLAHCADPSLPVASTAMVASPFDFSRVPLVAPLRPVAALTQGQLVTQVYRLLGGAPAPLVKRGYQLAGIDKYLMKPWTILSNLNDRELLAQIEAVDRFMDGMHAYPGRTFGQLYHRFFRSNDLADGRLALSDRTLELADVKVPVLSIAGRGDGIAPVAACHHVGELLPNAPSVQLATAPGGHLGVLTGRAARGTSWVLLDRFLAEHEAHPAPPRRRRRRAAA
jgi:polyhydroxyalkanoate synthase subunit PhaC